MTVYSFVEVAKFLLSLSPGLFLYSERFAQDPVKSFLDNNGQGEAEVTTLMCAIFYIMHRPRSIAIGHGGNLRKRTLFTDDALCRPLKKRPKSS